MRPDTFVLMEPRRNPTSNWIASFLDDWNVPHGQIHVETTGPTPSIGYKLAIRSLQN